MKILYSLLVIIFLSGCSFWSDQVFKSRTVEDFYISTGVEKYFLTDLPAWANYEQRSGCFRSTTIRYFNLDALMKSYAIDYNKALQVQAAFNEDYALLRSSFVNRHPSLKEEELLFYKVSEKISSNLLFFDPPEFKRINIIWLDEVLSNEVNEKKLRSLLDSSAMEIGVPVLVSFCLTKAEVEKRFPDLTPKMITAEMFSIYNNKGLTSPGLKIELDQIFSATQKLYFYSQSKQAPTDLLKGNLKIVNY